MKQARRLIRAAESWDGWRVVPVKGRWMLYPPNKAIPPITVHKTESDHRAWQNTIARLRRAGARLKEDKQ